ncbi:MAG: hypothetical protein ABIG69_11505 [Bacteroidota bacterium]
MDKEKVKQLIKGNFVWCQCFRKESRYEEVVEKLAADIISIPLELPVMPNEVVGGGQWQKCPKCDGQGIVSKPPWIAGDQETWMDTQTSHTCNLCNGMMVIKQ